MTRGLQLWALKSTDRGHMLAICCQGSQNPTSRTRVPSVLQGGPGMRGARKNQQGDSFPGRNIHESSGPLGGDGGCRSPNGWRRPPGRRWEGDHTPGQKGASGPDRGRAAQAEGPSPQKRHWGCGGILANPRPPSYPTKSDRHRTTRAVREGPQLPEGLGLGLQDPGTVSPEK